MSNILFDLSKLVPRKRCSICTQENIESTKVKGSFWNIFDKIICIHYLPYQDRLENIKTELLRVGILELPQFEWYFTVDNEYYQDILNGIDKNKLGYNENFQTYYVTKKNINYTLDSFSLLKMLKIRGFQRVLIIEDDLCMIDNLNLIKDIISSIPMDFDFINFDPLFLKKSKDDFSKYDAFINTIHSINKQGVIYYKFTSPPDGVFVYQTSMIALSGKFIDHIINQNLIKLKPFDHYGINDFGTDTKQKFNRYVTTINVGHQKYYDIAQDPRVHRYNLQSHDDRKKSKVVTYIQYYKPYETMFLYTLYRLCKQRTSNIVVMLSKNDKTIIPKIKRLINSFTLTKIQFQFMDEFYKFDLLCNNLRKFDFSALYRLFIPFLESFQKFDYSIYMDTDVYVGKRFNEVECINSILCSDFTIAGRHSIEEKVMIPYDFPKIIDYGNYLSSLGKMVFGRHYNNNLLNNINSGVIVWNNKNIDIKEYRTILYFVLWKYVEVLQAHPDSEWFKYPDQDIVNLIFDNISTLDKTYNWKQWWYRNPMIETVYKNVTIDYLDSICDEMDINIMHFQGNQTGHIKPALLNAIKSDKTFTSFGGII